MKKVNLTTRNGVFAVTFTNDMKYVKMIDLADAMGSRGRYIYSVPKAVLKFEKNNNTLKVNKIVDSKNYQFVDVQSLVDLYEKHKGNIQKTEKRTLTASIKGFMDELKGILATNNYGDVEEDDMQLSIDAIKKHLKKIESFQKDTTDKLLYQEKVSKLEDELEVAKKKMEELRAFNLKVVNENDSLKLEINSLRKFKNSIMSVAEKIQQ